MGLELDENEIASIPPTGKRLVIIDPADGLIKQLKSDGSKEEIAGGGSSWFDLEALAHATAIPSLTESVALQIGVKNVGETVNTKLYDASLEGGALTAAGASGSAFIPLTGATVWQNLRTSKFACSFQAAFATRLAAHANYLALINAAGSHGIVIASDLSSDATHFFCEAIGAGGSTTPQTLGVADTSVYTWRLTSDGTTVTVSRCAAVGGGVALSSATILTADTNYPTDAAMPATYATTGMTGGGIYKVLYSYVGP